MVAGNGFTAYYEIEALAQFLEWYGYGMEAKKLREQLDSGDRVPIACGYYLHDTMLAEIGIESDISWEASSHTPVKFHMKSK